MVPDVASGWSQRLRAPFWNDAESRLRAFWCVLGAVLVALVATSALSAVVVRPLDAPPAVGALASNGIAAVVALAVLAVWARYVDRRPVRAYGFSFTDRWWRMLGLGVAVGLLGWGGALATDVALDWASVAAVLSPGTSDLGFLPSYVLFVLAWACVGFWEEVIFRGIVLRNAIEGLAFDAVSDRAALVGGWVLSSVLFGVLHLQQATSLLALSFWILAGLVLGLAYLLTDQLAFPIGLHFAFDFGVNNVFGLASVRAVGLDAPTIIRPTFTGPETFVGISGAVNTGWLLVIGLATMLVVRWQYGSLEARITPYTLHRD